MTFVLPSKLSGHLRRISLEYKRDGSILEFGLVESAYVYVDVETEFDNWNGGTYAHDIVLYRELEFFENSSISDQKAAAERICKDLNELAENVTNEYWRKVSVELIDNDDIHFRKARPPSRKKNSNATQTTIWEAGKLRLFVSHRDAHKKKAMDLAKSLDLFGISSFVAHETIEPTKEWRAEIINGLDTMEAMLVFLTDDFHESSFTNQEIGYALGRNVPIVSLKLETRDPPGFINHEQAERGRMDSIESSALKISRLLYKKLQKENELRTAIINSFCQSRHFNETIETFNVLKVFTNVLDSSDVDKIIDAFNNNYQLRKCGYLSSNKRLLTFLETAGDFQFRMEDGNLSRATSSSKIDDAEIPF